MAAAAGGAALAAMEAVPIPPRPLVTPRTFSGFYNSVALIRLVPAPFLALALRKGLFFLPRFFLIILFVGRKKGP